MLQMASTALEANLHTSCKIVNVCVFLWAPALTLRPE